MSKGSIIRGGAEVGICDGYAMRGGSGVKLYDGHCISDGQAVKIYQGADCKATNWYGTGLSGSYQLNSDGSFSCDIDVNNENFIGPTLVFDQPFTLTSFKLMQVTKVKGNGYHRIWVENPTDNSTLFDSGPFSSPGGDVTSDIIFRKYASTIPALSTYRLRFMGEYTIINLSWPAGEIVINDKPITSIELI